MNHFGLIKQNVDLKYFTSWQVGGQAQYFSMPQNIDDLKLAIDWAQTYHFPITVIGGGTNILISDQGISGLVISTKMLNRMEVTVKDQYLEIYAQSGVKKSELLKSFLKYKLSPSLFLAGIPGDLGGGIVMNAGVSESFVPREFKEIVHSITVIDFKGVIKKFNHNEIEWGYRYSKGWQPGIILDALLRWEMRSDDSIFEKVKEANKIRLQKQPLELPNSGSVFVNPPGQKAAQLIDKCNLKGYIIGGAQVSNKHANFIVNLGGATAKDIWSLILYVQQKVQEKFGVQLEVEVIRLGHW